MEEELDERFIAKVQCLYEGIVEVKLEKGYQYEVLIEEYFKLLLR